jgi:glyoxylase-like metal-dependent hydrolase (beta-lactamase superfamily II)
MLMPRRTAFGFIVAAVIFAISAPLSAAQAVTNALPAGMTTYETVKLAEGIVGFIPPENNTAFVSGNSVAIIGDDGVLVVDSGHAPTTTERIISEIKHMTDKPVRFLVNTHWHPDHNAGNGLYKESFPGLQIVSTTATRDAIENVLPKKEVSPEMADIVRKMLKDGNYNGKPIDEETRKYYETSLPQLEAFVPELKKANHALPTLTFDSRLTIYLGKREVQVMFLGRGNTAGDAVIYVPDSKVLMTGDLVVYPVPYPFGSFFGEWIETMRKLEAIDATVIVPGHGPVMHDKKYIALNIELLEATQAQAADALKRGLTVDQAIKAADFSALRKQFVGDNPERAFGFDQGYVPTAITRAYREAKNGPLHDED